jgi:hypothetical protein
LAFVLRIFTTGRVKSSWRLRRCAAALVVDFIALTEK